MNWFMALKVDCCEPVPISPEACVSPPGVSVPNTSGMPPVELKKLISALATACWLTFRPPPKFGDEGGVKFSARSR
jgi:hypothetical protein